MYTPDLEGSAYDPYFYERSLADYSAKTFLWMFAGLLVTFVTAFLVYATGAIYMIFSFTPLLFILLIAEVGTVMLLSAKIRSLSPSAAVALFMGYAVLNGLTFSSVFAVCDAAALIFAFGGTALFFGGMAVYGFTTKRDLTSWRKMLIGGLIFLLIFWVLSLFLNLTLYETGICIVGILVFMGLTAYDTQKIKAYHQMYMHDTAMSAKTSIYAALELYLDFINIFLYLVRLFGRRD